MTAKIQSGGKGYIVRVFSGSQLIDIFTARTIQEVEIIFSKYIGGLKWH